jgi:hypothetical protein
MRLANVQWSNDSGRVLFLLIPTYQSLPIIVAYMNPFQPSGGQESVQEYCSMASEFNRMKVANVPEKRKQGDGQEFTSNQKHVLPKTLKK